MAEQTPNAIQPTAPRDAPTPIAAVLALTLITSFGTAVAWNGLFFVAEGVYGYDARGNLTLALVVGLAYAVSAFFAGRIVGGLRSAGLSSRGVLAVVLVAAGVVALVPLVWRSPWSIWVFGVLYAPLTGLLWPSVESYVSSGRRGADLARATGAFNLAWAVALMAGMWAMALLMEHHALWIIGGLAPVHLLSLVLLRRFTREPLSHGSASHEHSNVEARRYRKLLRLFRTMLVLSYAMHAALTPILPQIMGALGLSLSAKPALASVWMTTRLIAFAAMERWRGWHGCAWVGFASLATMGAGFVICLVAGSPVVLGLGLACFGVGVGGVYAGAIYYALEVGSAEVDAGGKHEASIGLGYAIGPLIFLLGGGATGRL